MKISIFIMSVFLATGAWAQSASRAPAVVDNGCDLDIDTTQVKKGSQKSFQDVFDHQVALTFDEAVHCHQKSLEGMARNEAVVLLEKYRQRYSKKCFSHFENLKNAPSSINCEIPSIEKVEILSFDCKKVSSDSKIKAWAKAKIHYNQVGKVYEEKSVLVVQKEQCSKVNKCLESAEDQEVPHLKKLQALACKGEIVPVETARAPAIERDLNYDGKRSSKSLEETKAHEVAPVVESTKER